MWSLGQLHVFQFAASFVAEYNFASLSLLLSIFHGKCSHEIFLSKQFLVSPVQTFSAWTRYATYTETNHSHFHQVPDLGEKKVPPRQIPLPPPHTTLNCYFVKLTDILIIFILCHQSSINIIHLIHYNQFNNGTLP